MANSVLQGSYLQGSKPNLQPTWNPQKPAATPANLSMNWNPQQPALSPIGATFAQPTTSPTQNTTQAPQQTPEQVAAAQAAARQAQQEAAERAEEQAYWDDQIALANTSLGRLSNQKSIGYGNIDSSYNAGKTSLTNSQAAAQNEYNVGRNKTVQNNVVARAGVDDGVNRNLTGLRRLLASKGAGHSKAANRQASHAAATQGNERRTQIASTFGDNLYKMDSSWNKAKTDFENSFADLDNQRLNQRNDLDSKFAEQEANLIQSQSDAAFNKAQAAGQAYTQARNARLPYQSRITNLMDQIDQLGKNISLTPKAASFINPELAQYNYDAFVGPVAGTQAGQAGLGAYWNLLQSKEEERR